jgi:hypothetical protein
MAVRDLHSGFRIALQLAPLTYKALLQATGISRSVLAQARKQAEHGSSEGSSHNRMQGESYQLVCIQLAECAHRSIASSL